MAAIRPQQATLYTENVQTDSYTLALADEAKIIVVNKATPATLTIPANAVAAFPIGSSVGLFQLGAGQVTVIGAPTIRSTSSQVLAPYSSAALRKRGTDEWVLAGDLAVAAYMSAVFADMPCFYLPCIDAAGTTVADYSGNALNGTTQGAPVLGTTAGPVAGQTALDLASASSQYVSRVNATALQVGDVFTLECWNKGATHLTPQALLSKGTQFYWKFNGGVHQLDKENISTVCTTTAGVTDTNWHHLAVTKSGATVHMYIDGADVTGAVTNATMTSNATVLSIGAKASASEFLNGSLAHVAIYPTALSAARVAAHFGAV